MSKIHTGNTYLDALLCMLVPVLLRHLVPFLSALPARLWPAKAAKAFSRSINFTQYYRYVPCADSRSLGPSVWGVVLRLKLS